MKKILQHTIFLFLSLLLLSGSAIAAELSGTYVIDSTQTPSTTVFRNINSAITFLTSANARTDGGPSNIAPFGVNGPVVFNVVAGTTPYLEQVLIPAIPGASPVNTITINGNGNTLQFIGTAVDCYGIRLSNAKYVTINNLIIKPMNIQYAWGIHFYLLSDSNTISNCTIDFANVTTAATTACGIVMSNSTTSPTSSGAATTCRGNIIINNTINGHPSGGPYYGITIFPASGATVVTGNKVINNIIQNYYSYGVYAQYTNGTKYANNTFRNPNRTTNTTVSAITIFNGSRRDTIINNTISEPFGTTITSTSTFYGVYFATPNVAVGNETIIANNKIFSIKSNGTQYGVYFTSGSNTKVYHNTIVFDASPGTETNTYTTAGFYTTGNPSGGGYDFRNNIVHINRGGASNKYAVYFGGTGTLFNINNNVYSVSGPNSYTGYYITNYTTFANWRTANGGLFDANTVAMNPRFVNSAAGNLTPQEGFFNDKGANLTATVPLDFAGNTRSTTPDPGILEFVPGTNDAGINMITTATAPFAAGTIPVNVQLRNSGTAALSTVTIKWTINGVPQTPFPWTGTLNGGAVSANVLLGTYTASSSIGTNIVAWTENPNGGPDGLIFNDSAYALNLYSALSGVYTINALAPKSATNYQSMAEFALGLNNGGVLGPVTANVVAGSGPYTAQVQFTKSLGTSILNTVTINGNGEVIQATPDINNYHVVLLNGADYMRFNNMVIKSLNVTYAIGMQFMGRADSNIVDNVTIDFSNVGTGTATAFLAFSATMNSTTAALATHNGIGNIIRNSRFVGNPAGGPYYGINHFGGTTEYSTIPSNNLFLNNDIINPYVYAIYNSYSSRNVFRSNKISQPTRTTVTTFYGMYMVNTGYLGDTVEYNKIFDIYKAVPTGTSQAHGIYMSSAYTSSSAAPGIYRNNMVYNFSGNGIHYGVYTSSVYYLNFYHNTISLNDPLAPATGITYAYYNTTSATTTHQYYVRNNIFSVNRGGAANKYGMYLNTTVTTSPATFVTNNNAYYMQGANSFVGSLGAVTYTTLANWQTANTNAYDQQSVYANPKFRTYVGADYLQPATDSLDNKGANLLTVVPVDFAGVARTTTPDIGAYEFFVPQADAGISRLNTPINPITTGFHALNVTLKNYGSTPLTYTDIEWSVNDTIQPMYTWSGSIAVDDTAAVAIGSYTFPFDGIYTVKLWSKLPNLVADSFRLNDTLKATLCTPLSGTYTINASLPVSTTNFKTFSSLVQLLQTCGVSGPINVNIANGVYNENVLITSAIPGISPTNRIVFTGADRELCVLRHDASVSKITLLLQGARYLEFRNMTIQTTGSSQGHAVHIMPNGATPSDSIQFIGCNIKAPILTAGNTAVNAFIVSAAITAPTTAGNNAHRILVDSCNITGGNYAVTMCNITGIKGIGNVIRHTSVSSPFVYGIYTVQQSGIVIHKNKLLNVGNLMSATAYSIYVTQADNGFIVTKNEVINQSGGPGIRIDNTIGSSVLRNLVANNMVLAGIGSNVTYGIYDASNSFLDIFHNTIKLTTTDASYASAAIYALYNNAALYNNLRLHNNVFTAPNGALAIYFADTVNLATSNLSINNNVYYSTNTYPVRLLNNIYTPFSAYITRIQLTLPTAETASQFLMPDFFSSTNLRSITSQLDSVGIVLPSVPDDIDGNLRSINASDIGINEFAIPPEDAGVAAVLTPIQPIVAGNQDVVVLIKNYGTSPLSSVDVTYSFDTIVRTKSYTGTLAPGMVDTVKFTATSGVGSTSQQFTLTTQAGTVKAWTTSPNFAADIQNLNDTARVFVCSGLSGTYTINPAGSGTSNFTSFQAAIDKMICGGVNGEVTFNVASGVYNGQIEVPTIFGASITNRIIFQSLTGNPADVTLTSNTSSSATTNYTLRLFGARFITFRNMTMRNTNATFGRVISINKNGAVNINTQELEIRNCLLEGISIASTADAYDVINCPTGDHNSNITIVGCTIKFGSRGAFFGGQNIINQFTPGLRIDSCNFFQNYYAGIWCANRIAPKIRANVITAHPTYTGYYGIYFTSVAQDVEVRQNYIYMSQSTYGVYVNQLNNYGEPGLATFVNNVINFTGAAGSYTQYGMSFNSSSNVNIFNNSISLNSTTTGSYALAISGNAAGSPQVQSLVSSGFSVMNNILRASAGYSIYFANIQAVASIVPNGQNNNLYYSTGVNFGYINGINYTPATFNSFKGMINAGSDRRSLNTDIVFAGANLRPDSTSPTAWAANGRATFVFNNPIDINGKPRSTQPVTGVPDIGAHDFNPVSTPINATFLGTIVGGNTQFVMVYGDTVASIAWGFGGTLPTSVTAKYYPGSLVSDPERFGVNYPGKRMDVMLKVFPNDGSFYDYGVTMRYHPDMLGTVDAESNIMLSARDTDALWSHYSGLTLLDTVNKTFGYTYLLAPYDFTGSDNSLPLPVRLNSFDATRRGNDVALTWTTASEQNNDRFVLERSFDGRTFERITTVKGMGTTNKLSNYAYMDQNPRLNTGVNVVYYRLLQIDFDGTINRLPIRAVRFDENEVTARFVVYPNPVNDKVSFSYKAVTEESIKIIVTDMFGKTVALQSINVIAGQQVVTVNNLERLPVGMYTLKIEGSSSSKVTKFLKN
ncbi:MAG: right-handed parallel beta-helix repeat-containing protein [Bacteroidota bacterium]